MKKILFSVALCATLFSCGKSAEDLNVDDIKSECDCIEFATIVLEEMVELKESVGDGEPSEDQEKQYESLENKANEIKKKCKEMDRQKMKECDGYDKMEELAEKV